ncbi:MAG: site-specific integrase, partial [Alistipes sp.]|nr:site-specific integrase [Alistipes sp.]
FCKQDNVRTVLKTFKEQIDEIHSLIGIDYEKITWRRYDVCFRSLQEVVKREFKKEDISFYEFDRNVIRKLELHLKTERGLCENTIVRYMKCVKKLTNIALANEWLRKDPFIGLRYKQPETNPSYLTMEELSKIRDYNFNIPRLNVVRDTFIFCCYTGLAFSDAKELRPEHITTDNNGRLWIHKERIKMKRRTKKCVSSIPLMQTAIDLLDKYRDNPKCLSRGTCLPLYSNQKMNDYLKEIAEFCGIDKTLTTPVARHTFATTVTLGNNVSLVNVSKMLGHTSTRMTKYYARVMDYNILSDMEQAEKRMERKLSIPQ